MEHLDYIKLINGFLDYGEFTSSITYGNNYIDVFYNAILQGGCEKWFQFGWLGYLKSIFPQFSITGEYQMGSRNNNNYCQVDINVTFTDKTRDLIELKFYTLGKASQTLPQFLHSVENDVYKLNNIVANIEYVLGLNKAISISIIASPGNPTYELLNFGNQYKTRYRTTHRNIEKYFTSGKINFEILLIDVPVLPPPMY